MHHFSEVNYGHSQQDVTRTHTDTGFSHQLATGGGQHELSAEEQAENKARLDRRKTTLEGTRNWLFQQLGQQYYDFYMQQDHHLRCGLEIIRVRDSMQEYKAQWIGQLMGEGRQNLTLEQVQGVVYQWEVKLNGYKFELSTWDLTQQEVHSRPERDFLAKWVPQVSDVLGDLSKARSEILQPLWGEAVQMTPHEKIYQCSLRMNDALTKLDGYEAIS